MKFYAATTKLPMLLTGILVDGMHLFGTGAKVSAMLHGVNRWHLNAEHNGEFYDGYADSADLEFGEVIDTDKSP